MKPIDWSDPFGLIELAVARKTAELEEENAVLKDIIQELEIEIDDLRDYKWMREELQ